MTLHGMPDYRGFESVIGNSKALRDVLDRAMRAAHTDANVLILGETGTGKELLAKAVHAGSDRRSGPFAVISCASIPRDLLESELFGYVRGSFTGAVSDKKGKVEIADRGTILLDEIGEMPLDLQVRILRLIQEKEIEKVGSSSTIKVDLRIIAATHRDLEDFVRQGKFREDLYYRLAVIPLVVPPLRDRIEDLGVLADNFLTQSKRTHGKPNKHFSPSVLVQLAQYSWPGNIRELQNVIERLVVLSTGDEITVDELPESIRSVAGPAQNAKNPAALAGNADLSDMSLEDVERSFIVEALRKCQWNQSRAAEYLAISRKTLLYRIAKYGIEREVSGPDEDLSTGMINR